jgi:hypothetical protein
VVSGSNPLCPTNKIIIRRRERMAISEEDAMEIEMRKISLELSLQMHAHYDATTWGEIDVITVADLFASFIITGEIIEQATEDLPLVL